MDVKKFIDIESAKERFMENEDLYRHFLFEFSNRTLLDDLEKAYNKGDVSEAFEAAHRMKGVIENLSLYMLGKKIRDVVEVLRNENMPEENLMSELRNTYKQSIQEIEYIKDNNIKIF